MKEKVIKKNIIILIYHHLVINQTENVQPKLEIIIVITIENMQDLNECNQDDIIINNQQLNEEIIPYSPLIYDNHHGNAKNKKKIFVDLHSDLEEFAKNMNQHLYEKDE